jgi:CRP-like cAMP-binding protein
MNDKLRKLKDKASSAFSDSRWKEALRSYAEIVEEDPTEIAARIKIGDIHRRLGNRKDAITAYEPVARHYAEDGLLLKAIAVCKLILSVDATHTKTQDMLANLYSKRSEPSRPTVRPMTPVVPVLARPARHLAEEIDIDTVDMPSGDMVIERTASDVLAAAEQTPPPAPMWPPPPSASTTPVPAKPSFSWPVATSAPPPVQVIVGAKIEAPPPQVVVGKKLELEVSPPEPFIAIEEPEEEPLEATLEDALIEEDPNLESLVEKGELDVAPRFGESRPIELSKTVQKARTEESAELEHVGLPQIPLFSDLPKEAFIEILVQMTMRDMKPGDAVIREGEIGDSFFVIASGKVRVARKAENGELILAYLTDGAFFGEMALLQDGARTASVIVEEDSQLFEISRGVLDRVVAQFPNVARILRNFYTQRLLSTTMATHPVFRPFAAEQRRELMEKFRSRMFKDGDVLVKEGTKGEGLYLLLTGTLEVSKEREGMPFVIAELGTGDLFGEMSLLMNRPVMATVTATKDSFVLRLAKKDFDELIMTHPQVLELVAHISEERETENSAIFAGWTGTPESGAALV